MKSTGKAKRGTLVGGVVLLLMSTLGGLAAAQTCIQPPAGLVNWWPGEGTFEDIVGGNDGVPTGNVGFGPGMVNQAFHFLGAANVGLPSATAASEFTIEAWVFANSITSPNGYRTIYADHSSGFWLKVGRINWWRAGDRFLGNTAITTGLWYHIALTYSQGEFAGYLNGQPDGTSLSAGESLPTGAGLGIGGHVNNEPFLGLIDEIEVYDRALSATEILALFNAGSAGKCRLITVGIDIKPGSDPNSVNPRSKGVIAVVILTTDALDATTVDPLSVRFGPGEAAEGHGRGHVEDADGDGDLDLILHFRTQETGIQCGDSSASLTGDTFGGQSIAGSDSVNTVGCS